MSDTKARLGNPLPARDCRHCCMEAECMEHSRSVKYFATKRKDAFSLNRMSKIAHFTAIALLQLVRCFCGHSDSAGGLLLNHGGFAP